MGFKLQRAACIWFGSVSSSDKQYFLNDTHENKANSYFFFFHLPRWRITHLKYSAVAKMRDRNEMWKHSNETIKTKERREMRKQHGKTNEKVENKHDLTYNTVVAYWYASSSYY